MVLALQRHIALGGERRGGGVLGGRLLSGIEFKPSPPLLLSLQTNALSVLMSPSFIYANQKQ